MALIAFMPSNPNGALGSADYPKEERRALATKSRETPPKYGSPERQKLIDEVVHSITLVSEQCLSFSYTMYIILIEKYESGCIFDVLLIIEPINWMCGYIFL